MHISTKNNLWVPEEVFLNIFSYLKASELRIVSMVSRFFQRISDDPVLWKLLSEREHLFSSHEGIQNWKEFYLHNSAHPFNSRFKIINNPHIEVVDKTIHLSKYPWLIYAEKNSEGERELFIRYKQKFAQCLKDPNDELRCRGGNDQMVLYNQASSAIKAQFQVDANSDSVNYSKPDSKYPYAMIFPDSRWLFAYGENTLLCTDSLSTNGWTFENVQHLQEFGNYVTLFNRKLSELSLFDLAQFGELEAIQVVETDSQRNSFYFPNLAYIAKGDSPATITIKDINTNEIKKITFESISLTNFGVQRFQLFGDKILMLGNMNKFIIKDINSYKILYECETNPSFSWKIFPEHNKILEKDLKDFKEQCSLRDLTNCKKSVIIADEIEAQQVHGDFLYITSSLSKTLSVWNLSSLELIRKIEIPLDFQSQRINFIQNDLFISGMNKSLKLTYKLPVNELSENKSGPPGAPKKAKRNTEEQEEQFRDNKRAKRSLNFN